LGEQTVQQIFENRSVLWYCGVLELLSRAERQVKPNVVLPFTRRCGSYLGLFLLMLLAISCSPGESKQEAALIAAGRTGSGPYDIRWDSYDKNGLPVDIHWVNDPSPSAPALCNGFPRSSGGFSTGTPPCVELPSTLSGDYARTFPHTAVCSFLQDNSKWRGHINWQPRVSYSQGNLRWNSFAEWPEDRDYTLEFTPISGGGLLRDNHGALHIEFSAAETIDHFPSPWWSNFRNLVRRRSRNPSPANILNHQFAVVSGVFGVDTQHGFVAEVHPVFALAIDVSPNRNDASEHWVFFVRNWGNEGYCSDSIHGIRLRDNRFALRIPWRDSAVAAKLSIDHSNLYRSGGAEYLGYDVVQNDGFYLTFRLPDPPEKGARPRVSGEFVVAWSPAAGGNLPPRPMSTGFSSEELLTREDDEPLSKILASLPPDELARLKRSEPPPDTVPDEPMPFSDKVAPVTALIIAPLGASSSVAMFDSSGIARRQLEGAALCATQARKILGPACGELVKPPGDAVSGRGR
jgi:hypothetical protein